MGKRVIQLFFAVTLVIFLIGLGSAASSCSVKSRASCQVGGGEYVVMGLSDLTNAHGEFPDNGTYAYVLCCNFGAINTTAGNTSCLDPATNPHPNPFYASDNIPRNKIIGLYASTNSHAEGTGETNYPINVCYKDLVCVSTTEGCDSTYPNEILNLSSVTNAHIGKGTGYNVAICCGIYAGLVGANCNLNLANWEYTSVYDKAEVEMILQGNNCPLGTAINFSIYEDDALVDDFVESLSGNYDRRIWDAIWKAQGDDDSGDGPRTYYFKAKTLVSGDEITSSNMDVSERSLDYCTQISLCSSYDTASECNTDFCDVATTRYEECAGKYSCSCSWNSETSNCEFSTVYAPTESLTCQNGYTLCRDPVSDLDFCYPGASCPPGTGPTFDGDGVCEVGEGCLSGDCNNGDSDSCVSGATCSDGMCSDGTTPQNVSGCENGYTRCYNSAEGLEYCYPGSICPELPLTNNDGICDFGEGCSSEDCTNSTPVFDSLDYKDSCLGDAYCLGGQCYSPTEASGNCVYHETTSDDCDDGLLTYSWTVEWKGAGPQPSSCADGSRAVPCPAQIQLPFFNVYTLIGAILVIAIIYYLIVRLRKKKPSRKHSGKKKKKK